MFCPRCRAEYRPGFTECADCLVPLVEELPPEVPKRNKYKDFRLVAVYVSFRHDAEIMCSLLQANGIHAVMRDEGSAGYRLNVGAMGEGRIFVPASEEADALKVIEAARAGKLKLER